MSVSTLALTENQGVIWFVRNPPWHSRWPLASCHALGIKGDATIIYRTVFPLGYFVLISLGSLLIHGLLDDDDDGGATLGERLTKVAADSPTNPVLVGLCCQKIHSLKTRSFFHLRSSPQVLFSYQRVLIEGLQSLFIFLLFALYKVLLFLLSTIPQNVQCVCPKPTFFFSTLAVGFGFDRVGWFYGPLKFPAQVVSSTRWQKQISFEDT